MGCGTNLTDRLAQLRQRVDAALDRALPPESASPPTLHRAMRHSVFAGGKRVRPILTLLTTELLGAELEPVVPAAAAIEMIHTYSLIHDDLPAMDDDDLRRGKPTCHKVYGEATAILAGDALQTLAFEVLSREPDGPHRAAARAEAVGLVATAAGAAGMVGGQELDLRHENTGGDLPALESIHTRKTCALIRASVLLGAIHADADLPAREALSRYGECIGLAFQITDDVLDVQSDSAQLGKTAGKDEAAGKLTYVSLLGLDESRRRARSLAAEARSLVEPLGEAGWLAEMATFIVDRLN